MTETLMMICNRMMLIAADLGLPLPGTVTPGDGTPAAGVTNVDPSAYGTPPLEPAGGLPMWIWVVYGGIFVAMYFVFFRPQRKREKKMKEMQAAITTGDNVVTSGGMFGKVADIGEDCFIVDFGTNRSIRIPVLKSDVVGIREPKMTPPPKIEAD